MNVKRYFAVSIAAIVLLGSLLILNAQSGETVQYMRLTPTSTIPSSNGNTSSAPVTLDGQIIPTINTGHNGGIGVDNTPFYAKLFTSAQLLHPMSFYLVLDSGQAIQLAFTGNVTDNDLWQYWSGRRARCIGQYAQANV